MREAKPEVKGEGKCGIRASACCADSVRAHYPPDPGPELIREPLLLTADEGGGIEMLDAATPAALAELIAGRVVAVLRAFRREEGEKLVRRRVAPVSGLCNPARPGV